MEQVHPNQIVQFSSNHGDVLPVTPLAVSKARQDARVHIFTAALLEHICTLYEANPYKRKKVLQGIVDT